MPNPIIIPGMEPQTPSAAGKSFIIHEWSGSGPDYLHVHHQDDEAWHVLEGKLVFRFRDRQVEAPAGTTVFVPAGEAHTYVEADGPARYLIILTPRLDELIHALHSAPYQQHAEILLRYASEMVT
jgi:uncharacterized cupin superfamily protein